MFMIDLGVESHYSLLGVEPGASPRDIRVAKSKIAGDLSRQRNLARTPDEQRSLEERMVKINAVERLLLNPKLRDEYDSKNAHLTFFVVRRIVAPAFEDSEVRLRWLHQAIRDFLVAEGDALDPLSDLERSDFSGDYTANELLEQLLNRGRQS